MNYEYFILVGIFAFSLSTFTQYLTLRLFGELS